MFHQKLDKCPVCHSSVEVGTIEVDTNYELGLRRGTLANQRTNCNECKAVIKHTFLPVVKEDQTIKEIVLVIMAFLVGSMSIGFTWAYHDPQLNYIGLLVAFSVGYLARALYHW